MPFRMKSCTRYVANWELIQRATDERDQSGVHKSNVPTQYSVSPQRWTKSDANRGWQRVLRTKHVLPCVWKPHVERCQDIECGAPLVSGTHTVPSVEKHTQKYHELKQISGPQRYIVDHNATRKQYLEIQLDSNRFLAERKLQKPNRERHAATLLIIRVGLAAGRLFQNGGDYVIA